MEALVAAAKEGDRHALEEVVGRIQDKVYGLSFKMLGHPEDAEDASQEILIKILIHLGGFRGDCTFDTWVYRVASNHLLTTRKRRAERWGLSFELLDNAVQTDENETELPPGPEREMLTEEIRVGCMQTMLLCLDRDHRLAFILTEYLEFNSLEASEILDITPEAFRKRISRGRSKIRAFLLKNCGLVNPDNRCDCVRQLCHDIKVGWIDPLNLHYAGKTGAARRNAEVRARIEGLDELSRIAILLRTRPECRSARPFTHLVRELLDSGKFRVLSE